ncbi:hypothetical protein TNCV_2205381 [Trichonephila clavipes]|nr:hypothetical protein TNCV_2205381 [Trichonephila clavipes]
MRTRPCVRPLRFSFQRSPRTGSKKVSVGVGKRENLAHSVTILQDALLICYKQSPDNAPSVTFSQRFRSPRLIEDETFNGSDIINNLINYEDGEEARFFESG